MLRPQLGQAGAQRRGTDVIDVGRADRELAVEGVEDHDLRLGIGQQRQRRVEVQAAADDHRERLLGQPLAAARPRPWVADDRPVPLGAHRPGAAMTASARARSA